MSAQSIVERLRAPAYWFSGSSEGHEGENDAPFQAADTIDALVAALRPLAAKKIPAKRRGNAGHYIFSHVEIEAARSAISKAKASPISGEGGL